MNHWVRDLTTEGLEFRFQVSALDAARNQKTGVPVSDAWPETDSDMSQLRLTRYPGILRVSGESGIHSIELTEKTPLQRQIQTNTQIHGKSSL